MLHIDNVVIEASEENRMLQKATQRLLVITTLLVALLALATGTQVAAETDPTPGGIGPLRYGCPGFPGNPAGGVCLYEPTHLEPRYGTFHSVKRSNGQTFSIPYLVGFIDVNSYNCAVHFYDVTYPGGQWTLEHLFSVWDNTDNGYGGYNVPIEQQARVDYGKFYC